MRPGIKKMNQMFDTAEELWAREHKKDLAEYAWAYKKATGTLVMVATTPEGRRKLCAAAWIKDPATES